MQDILKKVQIHMPFHILRDRYLPMVIRERINPEISFNHKTLDRFRPDDYRKVADMLLDTGLTTTIHAPFMDLRPGALDPKIRQATADRLRQVFDLAPVFRPRSIVCHPSFDGRYYVSTEALWLENSIDTWQPFLALAKEMGALIALENVYETDPHLLKELLCSLRSPHVCFCFDTGHFNVFAKASLEDWISQLGSLIGQLHLHDNHGIADEHLPPGEGHFPFGDLMQKLKDRGCKPIITLEAHSEQHLRRSLENIKTMKLLAQM
ncbi:MAG: sugar phosphate isomerase/epimerase family protein [Pseudomonadota bacterium]